MNSSHLTKPFIVVWDSVSKTIVIRATDNVNTYVPASMESQEFDTEQELEDYISENNLIEDNLLE
ncbi:MAG: hypothetical protein E2590_16455 [Chryseobacterium sp.]|nr:hypothetical protein [Chryseobacterium sp.]